MSGIAVIDVTKRFNGLTALHDVSERLDVVAG